MIMYFPYFKRKKQSPYRIVLMSICSSIKNIYLKISWRYLAKIDIKYASYRAQKKLSF